MLRFGLVLVPLLFTCVAEAQNAKIHADMLERMDTDHDGSIKRDEFLAARDQFFVKQDEDGNGYLDKDEIGERKGGRGAARRDALRMNVDLDKDGKISREEFVNSQTPLFTHADTDSNGVLDPQEIVSARDAMQARLRQRRNANGASR